MPSPTAPPRPVLQRLLACIAAAAMLALTGCGVLSSLNPFGGDPDPVVVAVTGDSLMNNGNAARVIVYQLTGDTNFQQAPLETFWQDDRAALSDELAGDPQRVLLYPGEQRRVEIDLSEETRFLGVAANLRAPEPNQWRRLLPRQDVADRRRMNVEVGADRIEVQVPEEN